MRPLARGHYHVEVIDMLNDRTLVRTREGTRREAEADFKRERRWVLSGKLVQLVGMRGDKTGWVVLKEVGGKGRRAPQIGCRNNAGQFAHCGSGTGRSAASAPIKIMYRSIDGYSKSASFKTLEGARSFAIKWVGEHPEVGSFYAVSWDGVGKVTVEGASIHDLFPEG